MKRALSLVVLIAPALIGCAGPPLLRGAQASSGWSSCPRPGSTYDIDLPPGSLDQRLQVDHPAGSSASTLVKDLQRQGFKLQGSCATDASVYRASHKSWLGVAEVYWKVNPDGKLAWSRGYVAWDAL